MCNLNLFYFCRKDKFERKQKRKASETVTSESATENTSKDSHSIKKRKTDNIEKGSEVSVKNIKVSEGLGSLSQKEKKKKKKKKKVITGDGNAITTETVVKSEIEEREIPVNQHALKTIASKSNAKQHQEKHSDKAVKLSEKNLLTSKAALEQAASEGKKKKKKKRKKNKDGSSMPNSGSSVVDEKQNVKGSKQTLLSAKAGKSTESNKRKDVSAVQTKKSVQKTVSDDQSENDEQEATSDQANREGQKSAAERLSEKSEVKDSDQGKSERKGKRRKKKKKKKGDGLPKLSAERLLAYGINPKKLKYIKRDNYKGVTKSS